ncbi:MAG: hypothetical protein RMJ56_18255 [Gemmataceae bacterium]|nr:hypothetical protein [Gemmata sp.]MDW8199540.1 hypothetical protein [Gemmataceae bacterium]
MLLRLIPIAVTIALLLGCHSKKSNTPTDSDPTATYTIQLRNPHDGDKTAVTTRETKTFTIEGPNGQTESMTQEKHYEYTQHILTTPSGAKKPSQLTRTYKVAKRTNPTTNQLKTLALEGKTVTIEKKDPYYQYTINGQPIISADSLDLYEEFSNPDQVELDDLIPKTPVTIGQSWPIDPAVEQKIFAIGQKTFSDLGLEIDKTSSHFDCCLTRVYTKDGQQYGTMSFAIELGVKIKAVSPNKPGGTGTMKVNATMDVVIDGSSSDGVMKMTIQSHIQVSERGQPIKATIQATKEKTVQNLP